MKVNRRLEAEVPQFSPHALQQVSWTSERERYLRCDSIMESKTQVGTYSRRDFTNWQKVKPNAALRMEHMFAIARYTTRRGSNYPLVAHSAVRYSHTQVDRRRQKCRMEREVFTQELTVIFYLIIQAAIKNCHSRIRWWRWLWMRILCFIFRFVYFATRFI